MTEVNSDLGPCALGIHQAIGIWNLEATHRLTATDRSPTPGLLNDDQSACSFTSDGIYDLTTNIDAAGDACREGSRATWSPRPRCGPRRTLCG